MLKKKKRKEGKKETGKKYWKKDKEQKGKEKKRKKEGINKSQLLEIHNQKKWNISPEYVLLLYANKFEDLLENVWLINDTRKYRRLA